MLWGASPFTCVPFFHVAHQHLSSPRHLNQHPTSLPAVVSFSTNSIPITSNPGHTQNPSAPAVPCLTLASPVPPTETGPTFFPAGAVVFCVLMVFMTPSIQV